MAHDPINPIAAEFGESGEPIVPVKPISQIDDSEAFKKEMEKKSRTVNEKDTQDTRSQNQEQRELITIKPLIDEVLDTVKSELGSVLDAAKPTSTKQTTTPGTPTGAPPKVAVVATPSETSADLSQGDDGFSEKLPDAPVATPTEKPQVEHVAKQMAPPPLTTASPEVKDVPVEKKPITSVNSSSASSGGDSSSKERPPTQALPKAPAKAAEPGKPTVKALEAAKETPKAPVSAQVSDQKASQPLLRAHEPAAQIEAPKVAPQITSTASLQETKSTQPLPQTPPDSASALQQTEAQPTETAPPESPDLASVDMTEQVTPFETAFPVTKPSQDVIRTSKEDLEKVQGTAPIQPPPESDFSGSGKEQEREEKQDLAAASQNLLNSLYPTDAPNALFKEAIGFDRLPPHILDLFDRIVGVVTVLQIQGKTETTIHLNEQQSPLLQGAEIVVSQVSTAPGSYNIELKGSPQAVAMFQDNVEQLKKAFQGREEENKAGKKEFNFKINDIRISLKDG